MNLKLPETSILIFGIYMITVPGLGLIVVPELLFDLFQLSYSKELWTSRMLGLVVLLLGVYYCLIGKHKISVLYPSTVFLRYIAALFIFGLWASKQVEMSIILFASVDALAATWTMWALKKSS
ncbi:hypothetical protein [Aureispira anguillae]|uniref:Uncharacterized protein n=1 Tax=Aureispira anguillae TaxID=2864201 RepID=A0A915YKR2_9BACT|nr:hypothetical protein [Aureispira anguillae]BDS14583.1 hypothetical protein AsAng_0053640 [Aureispira anguillae]